MSNADYCKKGSWNCICQRCGGKFKAEQILREWNNLLVCKRCYEIRQPQDFVKGYVDKQIPPFTSPEPTDVFVD
jgi:hypothetical protein